MGPIISKLINSAAFLIAAFLITGCGGGGVSGSIGSNNPPPDSFIDDDNTSGNGFVDVGTPSDVEWNGVDAVQIKSATVAEQQLDAAETDFDMTGLVALWHLEETSLDSVAPDSDDTEDDSGNGFHGYEAGGVSINQTGLMGQAYDFDGSNDTIRFDHDPALKTTTAVSVGGWFKFDVYSTSDGMVMNQQSGAGWALEQWSVGELKLLFTLQTASGGTNASEYSVSQTQRNRWNFVVGTYDSATGENRLYVNGELKDTETAGSGLITYGGSNPICIGAQSTSSSCGGAHFDGLADEIFVFSRALSAVEIETLYQRQQGQFGSGASSASYTSKVFDAVSPTAILDILSWEPSAPYGKELPPKDTDETAIYSEAGIDTTGLVGLWHMNESSGTVVDSSGNSNDSTSEANLTYSASGKLNDAISFDGSTSQLHVTDNLSLDISTDEVTMAAWIYPTADGQSNGARILSKEGAYELVMRDNGGEVNNLRVHISGNSHIGPSYAVALNEWSHVVGVHDGTNVTIFVNGEQYFQTASAGALTQNNNDFSIGATATSPTNRMFTGQIDEASIWSRALTSAEVLALYKRGVQRLKLQVRNCNASDCSGASWRGVDNTDATYFTELNSGLWSLPIFSALGLGPSQYFQYRVYFETDDFRYSPGLKAVTLELEQ